MRKIYLIICSFLMVANAFAQQPILKVNDKDGDKVKLTVLKIDVKIVANIAITTMEMKFCNSSSRVLEGELTFPLPEGVSINRYALDINGIMREAVPIEKEKGQVVFENTIRKKVDPGLLEKVEGNSFRTRIYPLPAGGCRTIIIGYQEVLKTDGSNAIKFTLPLQSQKAIASFIIDINVFSKNEPEIGKTCNTSLKMEQGKNVYTAHTEETNFTPKGSFEILMPKLANDEDVIMQQVNDQYYFLINHSPTYEVKDRKIANDIAIIWDNSFSSIQYNRKKELEFIIALMQKINNGSIQLSTIGHTYNTAKTYSISNGICEALIMDLQNMVYDGATNYSKIQYPTNITETYLFTDGINTYGNFAALQKSNNTVHTITCAPSADFTNLKSIANTNGGQFINLNTISASNALKQLTQNPYRLIGVEHKSDISEVYPKNTTVNGNVAVVGISNSATTTLILQYGYGNVVTNVVKVTLNAATNSNSQITIDKIWAQQKIRVLEEQYDLFKKAIEDLGRQYNIVTRNTSLIVLDDVEDYVKYNIAPPLDLKAAYDSIINETKEAETQQFNNLLANAKTMMEDLKHWYNMDFSPKINIVVYENIDNKPLQNAVVMVNGKDYITDANGQIKINNIDSANVKVIKYGYNSTSFKMNGYTNNNRTVILIDKTKPKPLPYGVKEIKKADATTIQGRLIDKLGNPLASASILHEGTTKGITTNTEGYFSYAYNKNATLQFSYVGFETQKLQLQNGKFYEIVLTPLNNNLEEVVVTGGGSYRNDDRDGVAMTDSSSRESVINRDSRVYGANTNLTRSQSEIASAPAAAAAIRYTPAKLEEHNNFVLATNTVSVKNIIGFSTNNTNNNDPNATIQLKEISSNKAFIKTLEKTAASDRYKTYLTLRKEYLETPSFYFAVAKFFMANNERELGLQIMSNIADINLNDHELYKLLGYELKKQGDFSEALLCFKKVLDWRPQEIQSYRDYGLALQDAGLYQNALDTLYTCLSKDFDTETNNNYEGIEETILMDINNLIALQKNVNTSKINDSLIQKLDVDVRVVLNWNMNDSDMDLWVIDPRGEKCFYSNKQSKIGARMSDDFTAGYGPEQFILKQAKKGKYKVMLHYYGDGQQKLAGAATIMAEIYTNFGRPNQERKLITLQMDKDENREGILVGEFEF